MGRFSKFFGKKSEPVYQESPVLRKVPPATYKADIPYMPSVAQAPQSIRELPATQVDARYVHVDRPPPNSYPDPGAFGGIPSPRAPPIYSAPRPKPPQHVSPGDLPLYRAPGQRVRPEELRELREQIRQRYQLDVQIWGMRYLRERDRDIVEQKIKSADALLEKIRKTVISWDKAEFWDPHTRDYEKFKEIKRRVCSPGKRDWTNHPPWEEPSFGARPF